MGQQILHLSEGGGFQFLSRLSSPEEPLLLLSNYLIESSVDEDKEISTE